VIGKFQKGRKEKKRYNKSRRRRRKWLRRRVGFNQRTLARQRVVLKKCIPKKPKKQPRRERKST